MTTAFTYESSLHVPFRDLDVLDRCRAITRDQITRHPNPDLRIHVMSGDDILHLIITDMVYWMKRSDDENRRVILLLPNPCPQIYARVALLINRLGINCRNVVGFALDEYADQNGHIAPATWELGFVRSMVDSLWGNIDESLRMPREQLIGPTDDNISHYSQMMRDMGGVDMSYTGPGWSGHLAFIEPDAPEFDMPLDEWRTLGARVCTLSPFTLAQNSLAGCFGMSGDVARVPPKAATIGPADVINARNRIECHGVTIHGTCVSWQRMISRLCLHGPVCPQLPSSIHQELSTDVYVSHENAAAIAVDWEQWY